MILQKPVDDIKKFFYKRFSRVVVPVTFWGMLYEIDSLAYSPQKTELDIIYDIFDDKVVYHLWFVYMIIALYLFAPILSNVLNKLSSSNIKYSFGLWIFLSSLVSLKYLIMVGNTDIFWITEFLGYFAVGWMLHNQKIQLVKLNGYVSLAVVAVISVILANLVIGYSTSLSRYYDLLYEPFFILVAIGSCLIFKYFREHEDFFRRHATLTKIFSAISAWTYGGYLIHAFVLNHIIKNFFYQNGVFYQGSDTLPLTLFCAVITFILSLIITAILHHTPYLRRLV